MKFPSTRLRRNRKSEWSRRLINDTYLDKSDFILPIFVCEGKNKKQEIKSMPGIFRYSVDRLDEIISRASKNQIPAVAIFPLIESSKKNNKGTEALNKNNVICNAVLIIINCFWKLAFFSSNVIKNSITTFLS